MKPAYYWDACIFIAYFNDERSQHQYLIDHIGQFLEEAREGKCEIYTSTVTIAEITSSTLKAASVGTFLDFLRDFNSAIYPIGADPNTMALASHLRSQKYAMPSTPGSKNRHLPAPDAIHLATAISLNSLYNVDVSAFHTFDAGKSRGVDGGKGMPILKFEDWTEECRDDEWVKKVIKMKRSKPEHPSPRLILPQP